VFAAVLQLAKSRGHLDRPEYAEWRGRVPAWLADFWTLDGLGRFERRLGVPLPAAVRSFYANAELVVCVHSLDPYERDFFFAATAEEPCLCRWGGELFLGVAMHGHSGGVYAVRLGAGDNPPMATGFEEEEAAIGPLAESFVEFIRRAVKRGPPPEIDR
jgi:hypothetical protein